MRIAHGSHPHTPAAISALESVLDGGHDLRVVPQVLYEYWAVVTRPVAANGLGFSTDVANADLDRFKSVFSVLRDERGILEAWQKVARESAVQGKHAHDARLVAAMERHGLTHLLTFNGDDFLRYPGVSVLDPPQVTLPSA